MLGSGPQCKMAEWCLCAEQGPTEVVDGVVGVWNRVRREDTDQGGLCPQGEVRPPEAGRWPLVWCWAVEPLGACCLIAVGGEAALGGIVLDGGEGAVG